MKTVLAAALLLAFFRQDARELPTIPNTEYAARRVALSERLGKAVVLFEAEKLIPGMDGIDANTPSFDFHYLCGHYGEGDILVIRRDESVHLFTTGDPVAVAAKTGIADVQPREEFGPFVATALKDERALHTRLRKDALDIVKEALPNARLRRLSPKSANPVSGLRMVKSPAEMAMMKKAADATTTAHLAAMRACRPGMNEGELQKLIEDTFKKEGCDGLGFPSIVGSGRNGTILHYCENNQEVPADSLIVCDIGASHRGYVTDITRTIPTSGKFTDEQRKAYQCVLDSQKAAERILKAGITFGELDAAARAPFEDAGLTKWSYAHAGAGSGVRHGLSHYVGMAVHDSGTGGIPEGSVITIEPGYYDKDAGWGIRIEDIYLVTKDGSVRWSAPAPREIAEIEKLMEGARK